MQQVGVWSCGHACLWRGDADVGDVVEERGGFLADAEVRGWWWWSLRCGEGSSGRSGSRGDWWLTIVAREMMFRWSGAGGAPFSDAGEVRGVLVFWRGREVSLVEGSERVEEGLSVFIHPSQSIT